MPKLHDLKEQFVESVDVYFPKGESKERGQAMVLVAEALVIAEAYAQRKADEARIEELLAVQKSADAFDRLDHCGCDDYIPRRLATLNSQTPTPKNEMKRRGVA